MQHTPNIIKVAVEAAGGRNKIAAHFGISPWTVTCWTRKHSLPAKYIVRLCELGGNVISPTTVIEYIEKHDPVGAERESEAAA